MSFLFIFYIGNNKTPPITDEICWSLDFRYCEVQLYLVDMKSIISVRSGQNETKSVEQATETVEVAEVVGVVVVAETVTVVED